MLEPAQSQGYLVINYPQFENIARWEMEIYKKTGLDSLDYKLGEVITLRNSTYHYFDSTYFQVPGKYQYKINLYNTNNQLIAWQGNTNLSMDDPLKCDGCGTFNKLCVHKCVGSDYAYELQRWFHPNNGSSTFKLMSTFNYFDNQSQTAIPYYEYMGQTQFSIYTHPNNTSYMHLYRAVTVGDIANFQQDGYLANNKIIKFSNPYPNVIYTDKDGNAITPNGQTVYGVQKYLGKWNTYVGVETPILLHNNTTCANNVQWASDVFNDYADVPGNQNLGMPQADELICSGLSVGGASAGNDIVPCINKTVFDTIVSGFYTIIFSSNPCLNFIGDSGKKIIDVIHEVQFVRLDTLNFSATLTNNQIISPSGEIIAPDISLNKGLYRLNLFTDELGLITWVFEVEKNTVISSNQADFLTPTIYPVPITENQFQLKMEAAAKVKFIYKLYDSYMNEIYSKNFVLQKGEERTHTIKPQGNGSIPQGFLYNKFIFEDGSLKTMTIIK